MNSVWYLFRAELRARWRAWLAAALLIGLAGAGVLGAFAGARRTASVITRSATTSRAEDLSFGPDVEFTPRQWNRVDRLPGIETVTTVRGLIALRFTHGKPDPTWNPGLTLFPVDAGLLRRMIRPQMLAGRIPDPDRPDEAFVDETLARQSRLHVGQRIALKVVQPRELETAQSPADLPAGRDLDVVVTGIGRFRDEALRDPSDPQRPPEIVFTPAATARFASIHDVAWDLKAVRLTAGAAAVPTFERRVRARLHGIPVTFAERASADIRAGHAMRPYVVALLAFGILAGVASIAVISQLLGRQEALRRPDRRTLQAMGMTRGRFAALGAIEGAVIGVAGAVLAVTGAIALSPMAPIGPLRRLEPDPGVSVDGRVLALGAALIILLVVTRIALAASRRTTQPTTARVNRAVEAVARRAPVPIGTGIRLATEGGSGSRSIPLRSTMLGLCTAIAAISATLVFSTGLGHFITTPRLYGWNWDGLVVTDDSAGVPAAADALAKSPEVRQHAAGRFGQVVVHDATIPAIGIDGPPAIGIVHGQAPTHADEVAIGVSSMKSVHARVGERIQIRGPGGLHRYLVTGSAVFPRLAPYPAAEPTGLGIGAVFTRSGLGRLVPDAPDQFILVNLRTGPAGVGAVRATLERRLFTTQNPGRVLGPQRPNDVTSYDRLATTPIILAALLAGLALATAAHVLITSVRRRRRELAVLKTLGFTRRQVTTTVAAQASTMLGLAALIAIPIGIVVGEWCWAATARWLGVEVEQVIPISQLLALVGATILLANAIAFLPGRIAARVRPALALRAE